jgi:hypothetical protein
MKSGPVVERLGYVDCRLFHASMIFGFVAGLRRERDGEEDLGKGMMPD